MQQSAIYDDLRSAINCFVLFVPFVANLLPSLFLVEQLVDSIDGDKRDSWTIDRWKMVLVLRQVRSFGSIFSRNALLFQLANLGPDVPEVCLPIVDLRFVC